MRILLIGIILGVSSPAQAGHSSQSAPYQTENRVKVYRHGPTLAQKQADLLRYQHAIALKQQNAQNKARRLHHQAQQSAFERGYEQGRQSAAENLHTSHPHNHARRNRYGRRYTTAFFGSRFGAFNRPVNFRR